MKMNNKFHLLLNWSSSRVLNPNLKFDLTRRIQFENLTRQKSNFKFCEFNPIWFQVEFKILNSIHQEFENDIMYQEFLLKALWHYENIGDQIW